MRLRRGHRQCIVDVTPSAWIASLKSKSSPFFFSVLCALLDAPRRPSIPPMRPSFWSNPITLLSTLSDRVKSVGLMLRCNAES